MAKTLTMEEANRLARGRARVMRCPEDGRLWRVEGDGWVENHEPMGQLAWQTFLAEMVGDPVDEPTPVAARARAGDGYIHDLDEAYKVQGHVTVLCEELSLLRKRIDALRARADAEDTHPDLAKTYRKDADALAAIANACHAGLYPTAVDLIRKLDEALLNEVGKRLYDSIRALADGYEPQRHEEVAYSGDAADVLKDVLRDNLSPQALAVIAQHIEERSEEGAVPSDGAVSKQVWWFQDLLREMVGGYDAQVRLAAEVGV